MFRWLLNKNGVRIMRKVMLLALVLWIGGLAAYVVDGNPDDWNIQLQVQDDHFVNSSFVPDPLGNIDYNVENWNTGAPCPAGGERYDFEAIYFDNTDSAIYIGLVSSLPKSSYYFCCIRVHVGSNVYEIPKDSMAQGDLGIQDEGLPNYFIESSLTLEQIGNPDWGSEITVEAVEVCGNDHIQVTADLDCPNHPPVIAVPPDTSIYEGDTLCFTVSADDPDSDSLYFILVESPPDSYFADNGDGTADYCFYPDFCSDSTYTVTFIVWDTGSPALADTGSLTITVLNNNRPPEITATPDSQGVCPSSPAHIDVSATDQDQIECGDDAVSLYAFNLPTGASFVDNGNGTGDFDWTPALADTGVHIIGFYAADQYGGRDTAYSIVYVIINHPPVITAPDTVNGPENSSMQFCASVSDPDGDNVTFSYSGLPSWMSAQDTCFYGTPSYCDSGTYYLTLIATDDGCPQWSDTHLVVIRVQDVNQRPEISDPGPQVVDEGDTLVFGVTGTDPDTCDNDVVTLWAEDLPVRNLRDAANFTSTPGNPATGTFTWVTDYDDAGVYYVRFIAKDNHAPELADTVVVEVTVNNVNRPPVISVPPDQVVDEGGSLSFDVSATDPDGDNLSFSAEGLPSGATFVDNGNGTGTFNFDPDYCQAGVYQVTFIVVDDGSPQLADTGVVQVTVVDVNRRPEISDPGPQVVDEGDTLVFGVTGTDPDVCDNDVVTLYGEDLPSGADFSGTPGNPATGTFTWVTDYDDAGVYYVRFIARDNHAPELADTVVVEVTVNNVNRPPVISVPPDQVVDEGGSLSFDVSATDPDGDNLSFSAEGLPSGATFVDNGNGTGTFNFDPDYCQAGVYQVTFIVVDDGSPQLADTGVVQVTVVDVNRRPEISDPGPQVVDEGDTLVFGVTGTDPDVCDNDVVTLYGEDLPSGADFSGTPGNPATGTFTWVTDYDDAGVYYVRFIARDNHAPELADTVVVQMTVNDVNRPPVINVPGPQSVPEGDYLTFGVSAADPDGDPLTFYAHGLPSNATFTDNGNGTGTFEFSPDYCQAGNYTVTFIVVDNGSPPLADTGTVDITVINVNRPPEVVTNPDQYVVDSIGVDTVMIAVNAFDLDYSACGDDSIVLSYYMAQNPQTSIPVFQDFGNGTGSFEWVPDFNDIGSNTIYFIATDNYGAADTAVVQVEIPFSGCPGVIERFNFQLKKVFSYPGEQGLIYPIYMTIRDNGDQIGGYEVLIAWDPSCMTLTGVAEAQEIIDSAGEGKVSEYFDYNFIDPGVVDPWPAVRIVMLRDLANNVYTPPYTGPACQVPAIDLIFNMNYNWDPNYACDIKFVVQSCGDNTMTDPTGLHLYDNNKIIRVIPGSQGLPCDTIEIPTGVCPGGIEKPIVLWDGELESLGDTCISGDIWFEGLQYVLLGDVNLNTVAYEAADVVFFNERLLGYPWPASWDSIMRAASTLNSDINHNTIGWEMGDLVLLMLNMNGVITAMPSSTPEPAGEVYVSFPEKAELPVSLQFTTDAEVGGAYVILEADREVGTPIKGDIGNMDFGARTIKNEVRALMFNWNSDALDAGEYTFFVIPEPDETQTEETLGKDDDQVTTSALREGKVKFTVKRIEFCDRMGRPLRVYLNGVPQPIPGEEITAPKSQGSSGPLGSDRSVFKDLTLTIKPNPMRNKASIAFTLPGMSFVKLNIYDVNGRLVKTLYRQWLSSGLYTVSWDGRDARGNEVPTGVYFIRLEAGQKTLHKKVVLMRMP